MCIRDSASSMSISKLRSRVGNILNKSVHLDSAIIKVSNLRKIKDELYVDIQEEDKTSTAQKNRSVKLYGRKKAIKVTDVTENTAMYRAVYQYMSEELLRRVKVVSTGTLDDWFHVDDDDGGDDDDDEDIEVDDEDIEVDDEDIAVDDEDIEVCLLYTSPSPRDRTRSRMPSSA